MALSAGTVGGPAVRCRDPSGAPPGTGPIRRCPTDRSDHDEASEARRSLARRPEASASLGDAAVRSSGMRRWAARAPTVPADSAIGRVGEGGLGGA